MSTLLATPTTSQVAPIAVEAMPSMAGWSGSSVLLVALLAFAAGVVLTRHFSPTTGNNTSESIELQKQLDKSNQQLKRYQQEMSDHFITVSHLTANVTQSYRQIHEHLASSAIRLASPEIGRQLLKSGGGDLSLHDNDGNPLIDLEDIQAPRDYAPKVPGGVLSEEYGLTEADNDDATAPVNNEIEANKEKADPTENIS
ncbi:DUF1043 family protein [Porticoccaceae bacterium]|nr:DUF1043 family protein [Porticoccaceae bacterium]MDA8682561.1 DUF1043 family protein [Porticoccaceae bacterium]MDA8788802.1 DUF1043 family protein [Porticoccaceae bacterium]